MSILNIQEVMQYLPHRYPFLLVDRIVEFEANERIVGLKNVTINEPFFTGHFPGAPVMPGVLIIEAMAQTAAILSFKSAGEIPDENHLLYFAGIDRARFKRPVVPGDQLHMEVRIERQMRDIYKYVGKASVAEGVAVEASFMCAIKKVK